MGIVPVLVAVQALKVLKRYKSTAGVVGSTRCERVVGRDWSANEGNNRT
jgi:hypothetical protein